MNNIFNLFLVRTLTSDDFVLERNFPVSAGWRQCAEIGRGIVCAISGAVGGDCGGTVAVLVR